MLTFRRMLDRLIDVAMVVAEVAIVVMMLHITAELLSRWILREGMDSVPEFVAYYYMTSVAFLSLAYVTRGNGHIAAEFFTESLSLRARQVLAGVMMILIGLFMLLLGWQLTNEAISMTALWEVHQGVTMNLPKWPGRWIMAIGSGIMMVAAFTIGIGKLFGFEGESTSPVRAPVD